MIGQRRFGEQRGAVTLAVAAISLLAGGVGCREDEERAESAGPAATAVGAGEGGGEGVAPAQGVVESAARAEERERMVELLGSRGYGVTDQRVLVAMRSVPRHEFVPARWQGEAYADSPLPIGHGQTISQPFIVAFMTEQLAPKPDETVLEIGTGSGYQAAILAGLVKHVYTIEIVEPLALEAKARLDRLGMRNVTVRHGDGYQGWPEHAPFDAIIVTCAPDAVPQPLVDQLREGGRMIIPVGDHAQELYLLEKRAGEIRRKAVLPVRFVPMTGEAQER